jgi:hypothetical protein
VAGRPGANGDQMAGQGESIERSVKSPESADTPNMVAPALA